MIKKKHNNYLEKLLPLTSSLKRKEKLSKKLFIRKINKEKKKDNSINKLQKITKY